MATLARIPLTTAWTDIKTAGDTLADNEVYIIESLSGNCSVHIGDASPDSDEGGNTVNQGMSFKVRVGTEGVWMRSISTNSVVQPVESD